MDPISVYACYNRDNNLRRKSSSGAIFSTLANKILDEHGIVYGVAISDDCYSAEFISVTNKSDLAKLRGSKYLQAKVGNTFKMIQNDLMNGKLVLFSGTGCQVNGLKKYLGKDYNNLICLDIICHGTPSPLFWRNYVKYQEKQNNGKLKRVNFRCKDIGWNDYGIEEQFLNFSSGIVETIFIPKEKDIYMQIFLKNLSLRPSCYNCEAKKNKLSDLTIADFWGIEEVIPEMNDDMGISLLIIRTNTGKKIFDTIKNDLIANEVSYRDGVKNNPSEYKSCQRTPIRNSFFSDMVSLNFEDLGKKYFLKSQYSLKNRLKKTIKGLLKI